MREGERGPEEKWRKDDRDGMGDGGWAAEVVVVVVVEQRKLGVSMEMRQEAKRGSSKRAA